jgi:membrane-associated protease RseP (regulator of RpoE activity)
MVTRRLRRLISAGLKKARRSAPPPPSICWCIGLMCLLPTIASGARPAQTGVPAEPPAAQEAPEQGASAKSEATYRVTVNSDGSHAKVVVLDGQGRVIELLDPQGTQGWTTPASGDDWREVFGRTLGRGSLGFQTIPLSSALRLKFGAPEGLGVMVSEVVENGEAQRAGIAVGDIVLEIDGEPVHDPTQLQLAARRRPPGEVVGLELQRQSERLSVEIEIAERERTVVVIGRDSERPGQLVLQRVVGAKPLEADLSAVLTRVEERLKDPAWQERLHKMEERDLDSIRVRMRAVEEELLRLRTEIEELDPP